MTGYTKLFSSILGSTVWREPAPTKVVWITMLAAKDLYGEVEASIPGLAHLSGQSIEETETALATFLAPDPYSRTREHEGRRIEVIEGGWYILNHDKYRDKMSPEDMKAKAAIRQARFREKHKVTPQRDASVTCNANNDIQKQTQKQKQKQSQKANPPAASAAARGLCARLSLTGDRNATRLHEAIALEAVNSSQTEEEVADRFFDAWEHYRKNYFDPHFKIKLAVTFFEDGVWKDTDKMAGWSYKPTNVQSEQKPTKKECRCYVDGNGRERICPDCEDKNKAAKGRKKAK